VLTATVVHAPQRTHGFVVADGRGHLVAVHSSRRVSSGQRVRLKLRHLSNGTFSVRALHRSGARHRALLRGTVTYVATAAHAFVLSSRGVSVLVHTPAGGSARRARASVAGSATVGSAVVVDASLGDPSSVTAQDVQVVGQANGPFDLEGAVQAVSGQTLTVSADDADLSGATLTVHLPSSFDPTSYAPGDEVQLVVTPNPDGTFTAVGSSDDSNAQQADNSDDQQGDDQSAGDTSGDGSDTSGDVTDSSADPSADGSGDVVSGDASTTPGDAGSGAGYGSPPASSPSAGTAPGSSGPGHGGLPLPAPDSGLLPRG
jgi:hypothetical protein